MGNVTIQQLLCFDAVAREGGFQAAAMRLNRAHPSVFTAVKNLEAQLGLTLFDRTGYRVNLTEAGTATHSHAKALLRELQKFNDHVDRLVIGEESELKVVIGDLCPLPEILGMLRHFFDNCPGTRLHLHFEAISGPWERLLDGEADLIFHHVDKTDPRIEFIDLFKIELVPVVAPGFLSFPIMETISLDQMRDYVQCIIRDTARHHTAHDHFLIEGAHSWTVNDQLMKKELILQGMGWGHMPTFLVAEELANGRLLSIAGKHLNCLKGELVAARQSNKTHGPVAERLWHFIGKKDSTSAARE